VAPAAPAGLRGSALRAAIIDLDGTLIDTVGDFEVALARTLADLGYSPVSRAFISRTVGKGSEYLLTRTLAEVGAAADLYERAWQRYQHHYLVINGQYSSVFAGVPEGLQALRAAGIRLACITNKPGSFAHPLLASKGLAGYFEVAFGGDAFEHKKPHPQPLLEACKALASAPAQTLMVGDSSNDAAAARAAGCPVVLVDYGYNHGQPVQASAPDAVIASLADVLPLLNG
jgi:phosphoglycolate phosphatase